MPDHAPSYLSLPSAEIILSEVRPTKIKPETLLSVNVFVDELLWLILNAARSLHTERLNRDGLMKILPTGLGKEALLEAEVELKAYWDRTDPVSRGSLIEHNTNFADFPLQAAFELMRVKCEVYSTLGDVEEDIEEESRLQNQMLSASSDPPRASAVAPAALYITAMLEHVCEHILSNVAKVVARDSSRTTAHLQDLLVALSEDDSIYPLFKRMRVKDQLEAQAKALSKPRRSKSVNTHGTGRGSPSTLRPSISSSQTRLSDTKDPRTSGESSSGKAAVSSPPRPSGEKSRLKMFTTGRASSEMDGQGSKHKRSDSSMSDGMKKNALAYQDLMDTGVSDFEDLMKSGTTMKVSLTPDRLKTFEMFSKEKGGRTNRSNSLTSLNQSTPLSSDPLPSVPAVPNSPPGPPKLTNKNSRSNLVGRSAHVTVDSIEEAEDEEGPARILEAMLQPRTRTQSLAQFLQETPPPWQGPTPGSSAGPSPSAPPKIVTGRARSQTTGSGGSPVGNPAASSSLSPITPNSAASPIKKKTSGYLAPTSPPSSFPPQRLPKQAGGRQVGGGGGSGMKMNSVSNGGRRARNLEDIDLDELMADDDDDSISSAPAPPPPSGIRTNPASRNGSINSHSPISASTRDMIDFLSEGPPGSPPPPIHTRTVSSGNGPKTPTKNKTPGRFGRMISRLARSSSSEHMNMDKKKGSSAEDVSSAKATSSGGSLKAPTAAATLPQWTRPTPPPPPPVLQPAPIIPVAVKPVPPPQPVPVAAQQPEQKPTVLKEVTRKPVPGHRAPTRSNTLPTQSQEAFAESPLPATNREASVFAPRPIYPAPDSQPASTYSRSRPSTATSNHEHSQSVLVPSRMPSVEISPPPEADTIPLPVSRAATSASVAVSTSAISIAEKAIETEPPEPVSVPLPVTPAPLPAGAVLVDLEKAQQMRKLVAQATSVEECQVLVEMFLAQWGFPRVPEEVEESREVELGPEEEAHQPSLVETLLGDSVPSPESTIEDNQTDDAHDADPRTPKTPLEDRLHPDVYPRLQGDPFQPHDEPYRKKVDNAMLTSVPPPIIAA